MKVLSRSRNANLLPLVNHALNRDITRMLNIDLTGKRALVAGVADDAGFGFAIAKSLAEAGASGSVGTWPPALNIFMNLLERGKMNESRMLSSGQLLEFEKVYPLDAAYDTIADAPEDIRTNKRYKETGDFSIEGMTRRIEADFGRDSLARQWSRGQKAVAGDESFRLPHGSQCQRVFPDLHGVPSRPADAKGRI